ncbi:MAG TPA: hypothetical protein VH275_07590 [Solirubrobacterales bacterium]|nr:hypothetical protein [Solirubrobacterales bacterium]
MIAATAGRFDLAVTRFNASEAARTVAGLTRTLGEPRVSIGAAAGTAEAARITVAWDLTWYQWAVASGEREQPVAELARGTEIDQLDAAARQWNAAWRS